MKKLEGSSSYLKNKTRANLAKAILCLLILAAAFFALIFRFAQTLQLDLLEETGLIFLLVPLIGFYFYLHKYNIYNGGLSGERQVAKLLASKLSDDYYLLNDLFPGVYAMLVELKESGYQLAVATGKTRVGLQKALKATGTEELFCVTRCADETASKPDPKMLLEIIQHTQAAKERTLMIGDSIHDLQMALNAPISAIAVSCGANSAELLQQYHPLLCLQQPTELLNII